MKTLKLFRYLQLADCESKIFDRKKANLARTELLDTIDRMDQSVTNYKVVTIFRIAEEFKRLAKNIFLKGI